MKRSDGRGNSAEVLGPAHQTQVYHRRQYLDCGQVGSVLSFWPMLPVAAHGMAEVSPLAPASRYLLSLPEGAEDVDDATLKKIQEKFMERFGSVPVPVIAPHGMEIKPLPGPYSYTETLGSYTRTYTFNTLEDMERFLQAHRLGPWDDGGRGETSNTPKRLSQDDKPGEEKKEFREFL